MKTLQVSLNGRPCLKATVTLNRGRSASTLNCEVPGKVQAPYLLTIQDEFSSRVFRQFSVSELAENGDGTFRLSASDVRERWRNLPVTELSRDRTPLKDALQRLLQGAGEELPITVEVPEVISTNDLPKTMLSAITECVRRAGATFSIDDDGNLLVQSSSNRPNIPKTRLMKQLEVGAQATVLTGATGLEIIDVSSWEAVIPDEDGELVALAGLLAELQISESQARKAALSEAGFEKLLGRTGTDVGNTLARLKRFAYRLFRASTPQTNWIPIGGIDGDGVFFPPVVSGTYDQPTGLSPQHPTQDGFEASGQIHGVEIDSANGTIYLQHPPFKTTQQGPTWQERLLVGEPAFNLRIAVPTDTAPISELLTGQDIARAKIIHDPTIVPVYQDGKLLNALEIEKRLASWRTLAKSTGNSFSRIAGTNNFLASGIVSTVIIRADEHGLTSDVFEQPDLTPPNSKDVPALPEDTRLGPLAAPHQPINAYRNGPIIFKTSGNTPEGESVIAAEAVSRDPKTSALALENFGPFALTYFLDSIDTSRYGRWFVVAGCEATADGKVRILDADQRHEKQDSPDMQKVRKRRPVGLRGLLVVEEAEPVFFEGNPLIADSGDNFSTQVAAIDGDRISQDRRGGLQFLTNVVLSPAHKREDAGGGTAGWVPVLNFTDAATGAFSAGRGLFAEGGGQNLGRLTAHDQAGPILADGTECTKHHYGTAADAAGVFRENAGHISTDAFFKMPGDAVHDAPLQFYAKPFAGRVPPWRPYEARILYDASARHKWNKTSREGRWKIQYRLPFYPDIPPTWKPPIDDPPPKDPPTEPPVDGPPDDWEPPRTFNTPEYAVTPILTDNEIWAPSFDWIPASSNREAEREVPYPGPCMSSAGYAGETKGYPESASGGCVFLPPTRTLADSDSDNEARMHHVVLHPEVCLNFGHPVFTGDNAGGISDGWEIKLDAGELAITPLDEDGNAATSGTVKVDGLLAAEGIKLDPQSSNPGHASQTIWLDSNNSHLMRGSVDIEQLIADLTARVETLENGGG